MIGSRASRVALGVSAVLALAFAVAWLVRPTAPDVRLKLPLGTRIDYTVRNSVYDASRHQSTLATEVELEVEVVESKPRETTVVIHVRRARVCRYPSDVDAHGVCPDSSLVDAEEPFLGAMAEVVQDEQGKPLSMRVLTPPDPTQLGVVEDWLHGIVFSLTPTQGDRTATDGGALKPGVEQEREGFQIKRVGEDVVVLNTTSYLAGVRMLDPGYVAPAGSETEEDTESDEGTGMYVHGSATMTSIVKVAPDEKLNTRDAAWTDLVWGQPITPMHWSAFDYEPLTVGRSLCAGGESFTSDERLFPDIDVGLGIMVRAPVVFAATGGSIKLGAELLGEKFADMPTGFRVETELGARVAVDYDGAEVWGCNLIPHVGASVEARLCTRSDGACRDHTNGAVVAVNGKVKHTTAAPNWSGIPAFAVLQPALDQIAEFDWHGLSLPHVLRRLRYQCAVDFDIYKFDEQANTHILEDDKLQAIMKARCGDLWPHSRAELIANLQGGGTRVDLVEEIYEEFSTASTVMSLLESVTSVEAAEMTANLILNAVLDQMPTVKDWPGVISPFSGFDLDGPKIDGYDFEVLPKVSESFTFIDMFVATPVGVVLKFDAGAKVDVSASAGVEATSLTLSREGGLVADTGAKVSVKATASVFASGRADAFFAVATAKLSIKVVGGSMHATSELNISMPPSLAEPIPPSLAVSIEPSLCNRVTVGLLERPCGTFTIDVEIRYVKSWNLASAAVGKCVERERDWLRIGDCERTPDGKQRKLPPVQVPAVRPPNIPTCKPSRYAHKVIGTFHNGHGREGSGHCCWSAPVVKAVCRCSDGEEKVLARNSTPMRSDEQCDSYLPGGLGSNCSNCKSNPEQQNVNCMLFMERWTCSDFFQDDPEVCNGRGECQKPENWPTSVFYLSRNRAYKPSGKCKCDDGYVGANCETPVCSNLAATEQGVCSGNGDCTDRDECKCKSGWTGADCSKPICFGVPSDRPGSCGHDSGVCKAPDVCECTSPELWRASTDGGPCDVPVCDAVDNCGGRARGHCYQPNLCWCNQPDLWGGPSCATPLCGALEHPCGGHGNCRSPHQCECDDDDASGHWDSPVDENDGTKNRAVCSVCKAGWSLKTQCKCRAGFDWTGQDCAPFHVSLLLS